MKIGMDLGYDRLSEDELNLVISGKSKLHYRSDVPGFAAMYGAYEDPTGDKLQRIISYIDILQIKERIKDGE